MNAQQLTPCTINFESDDVTLQADAFGDPRGKPVVLLHGGGQTRHSWGATCRDLAEDGWYTIAVDQRGHGASEWSPDGDYAIDRFAHDVMSVADTLDQPPVLIGASLGGIASLSALGRNPGLAAALVLVDVSPFVQVPGANRIIDFMIGSLDGFESLDEAAAAVADYLPHRPRPTDPGSLRKNLREVDGRLLWHWDPAFVKTAVDPSARRKLLMDLAGLADGARNLRVPTLLVRGGESDVITLDDAHRFLRAVPRAEFATVDGAHHMVVGDDNAVFARTIKDFLHRHV